MGEASGTQADSSGASVYFTGRFDLRTRTRRCAAMHPHAQLAAVAEDRQRGAAAGGEAAPPGDRGRPPGAPSRGSPRPAPPLLPGPAAPAGA